MTIMNQALPISLAAVLMMTTPALAQTCNDHIPAAAPDSRYTNHGNGTVTDNATGLMWKRCAEGLSGADCASGSAQTFTWQQALHQGGGSDFAGYNDWRLPNVNELSSLVEERCNDPAINVALFPNTPLDNFWSSSPSLSAYYSNDAWIVYFYDGVVLSYYRDHNYYLYLDYNRYYVRLVRGGR